MRKYIIVTRTQKELNREFFEHVLQESKKWNNLKMEFNMLVDEKFGYHYYNTKDDTLMDIIEFADGKISYKKFLKIMIENTPSNIR
jgi:hypothetical protein